MHWGHARVLIVSAFLRNFPIDFADIARIQIEILVSIDYVAHFHDLGEYMRPGPLNVHDCTGETITKKKDAVALSCCSARLHLSIRLVMETKVYQTVTPYHKYLKTGTQSHQGMKEK